MQRCATMSSVCVPPQLCSKQPSCSCSSSSSTLTARKELGWRWYNVRRGTNLCLSGCRVTVHKLAMHITLVQHALRPSPQNPCILYPQASTSKRRPACWDCMTQIPSWQQLQVVLLTAHWLTGEVLQLVCNFDHFCSTLAVGVSRAAHGSQAKNSRQGSTKKDRETVPGEDGGAAGCCKKGVLACVSYFQEVSSAHHEPNFDGN